MSVVVSLAETSMIGRGERDEAGESKGSEGRAGRELAAEASERASKQATEEGREQGSSAREDWSAGGVGEMEAVEALGNITEVIDKAVVVGERATLQRTNCNTLLEPIRHLKPLLDEVRDWSVSPVAGGGGGGGPATFDGLELAVTKAKELLDKCGASGSKVYTVSVHTGLLSSPFSSSSLLRILRVFV